MKKIVMGIAAVAMAASVFAADVSAKVKLYGDLFNYNGVTEEAKLLTVKPHASHNWEPDLAFSVSTDEAGAEIAMKTADEWSGNDNKAEQTTNWKIWFKPLDVLTVKVGCIGESMNTETIDWSNRIKNFDSYGYEVVYSQDAITVAASFVTGAGSYLFNNDKVAKNAAIAKAKEAAINAKVEAAKNDDGVITPKAEKAIRDAGLTADEVKEIEKAADKAAEAALGQINIYGAYSADFGTIKAMFDFTNTFKDNTFAVGYNNTFDALNMFADVALTTKEVKSRDPKAKADDKMTDIGAAIDAFAAYTVDALTAKLYVKGAVGRLNNISKDYGSLDDDGNEANAFTLPGNVTLMMIARADYKLDPVNAFVYFKAEDLLKKGLKEGDTKKSNVLDATIRAGLNGSVGICAWEGYLQLETGKGTKFDKVDVSVPVNFTVNF